MSTLQPADRLLFYVVVGDRIVRGAHRVPPVKATPVMVPPSAVFAVLPPWVDGLYKAAGVLAYSYDDMGQLVFLLADEARQSHQSKGRDSFWNILGGKRERCDRFAEDTAVREFVEETAGVGVLLRDALIASLASAECLKFWQAEGKYVLFVAPLPYVECFPALFAAATHLKPLTETCITRQLKWVPAAELLHSCFPENFPPRGDPGSFYPFLLQTLRIDGARKELERLPSAASATSWRMGPVNSQYAQAVSGAFL